MSKACYRKLHRYKYQLVEDYTLNVGIQDYEINHDYMQLKKDGTLTIRKHYAWDGPSGFSIDTRTFMRGSLVHDALYQLMRLGLLDRAHRERADNLLQEICEADGMWKFRAWYVRKMVRWFGAKYADPGNERKDQIICVPQN